GIDSSRPLLASNAGTISQGIDIDELHELKREVLTKAYQEDRVQPLTGKLKAYVEKIKDYYEYSENRKDIANAININNIYVVSPDEEDKGQFSPFYLWSKSPSKFILTYTDRDRIYIPLKLFEALIELKAPLELGARIIYHNAKHILGAAFYDDAKDTQYILENLTPYLIKATITKYGPEEEILGAFYGKGDLKQESVRGDMAFDIKKGDIPILKSIKPERLRDYIAKGVEAVQKGLVVVCVPAGGAATRMPMDELPGSLKKAILKGDIPYIPVPEDKNKVSLPSKALVPLVPVKGKWHNYLSLYLTDQFDMLSRLGLIEPASQQGTFPFILATSKAHLNEQWKYLEKEGWLDKLDIMRYWGVPGKRIYPTVSDVNRMWEKGKFHEFFKDENGNVDEKAAQETYERSLLAATKKAGEVIYVKADKDIPERNVKKGQLYPISAPRGHAGNLHHLFTSERILDLVKPSSDRPEGIKYIYFHNIDNVGARIDENWLAILGYMIENERDIVLEVSKRPKGQSGGTAIKYVDDAGNIIGMQIAEYPALDGTSINPKTAYYINNAAGFFSMDILCDIYNTDIHELRNIANIEDKDEREAKLINVRNRGVADFFLNPTPKIVKDVNGQYILGVAFEQNMWESTAIPGISSRVGMIEVDSVEVFHEFIKNKLGLPESIKLTPKQIDDYISSIRNTPEEKKLKDMIKYIRFIPNKNWVDYELNHELVSYQVESLASNERG
ncbi:MAG: UTP--glucose-1-phosphate uridylyltransferase, partial [Deltaproteobacteria bacterium]|nr:UTP--glucose-1-phosphate uridylyltransferase [Deltaproteobacteria bacterium]